MQTHANEGFIVSLPHRTAHRRSVVVVLVDVAVLLFARPDLALLHRIVRGPATEVAELGPDRAAAACVGAVLWLIAAWVAIGLLAMGGSALPGAVGRACAAAAHLVTPVVVRRLVGAAIGVGLVAGPAYAATAASPAPAVTGAVAGHLGGAVDSRGPGWPTPPAHTPRTHPSTPMTPGGQVRVDRGDSLWLIAAHRLPGDPTEAQIAAYWPQIYAANRTVIGADPDHITPGQVLSLPDPSTGERSSS